MAKLRWELLKRDNDKSEIVTWRARVPGGWLVSVWAVQSKADGGGATIPGGSNWGGGLTFLPDPDQKPWDVEIEESKVGPSKKKRK